MKKDSLIQLPLGDKIINLHYNSFDTDIDMDSITSIDYSNLYGEMVTVSALLNRIGIIKADIEHEVKRLRIQLNITEAEKSKYYRSNATANGEKPTVPYLEGQVTLDPNVKNERLKLIRYERDLAYIESIYWSINSKDKKLSVLMKGVTPIEFEREILEGSINTMLIVKKEKLIK